MDIQVTSSTISDNAEGFSLEGDPDSSGSLFNSVVANSNSGADLIGSFDVDYSLVENVGNSQITEPIPGSNIFGEDPSLGPLQNNGGPTETHALLPGSPAIDAGDPAFIPPPEFDQRGEGFRRVQGGRIDMGAYEALPGAAAAIAVQKWVNGEDADNPPGPIVVEGDPLVYDYAVTNEGWSVLTNVKLFDQTMLPTKRPWRWVCNVGDLAPGESASCTDTASAKLGQHNERAVARGLDATGDPIIARDNAYYLGEGAGAPAIQVEKSVNGEDADSPTGPVVPIGNVLTYKFVVTNTGNVPLDNVKVFDQPMLPTKSYWKWVCNVGTLNPGKSGSCTATDRAEAGQHNARGIGRGQADATTVQDMDNGYYLGQ